MPRATYTQTHIDYVIEAFEKVKQNVVHKDKSLTFTYEPSVLRHFTARLKEVEIPYVLPNQATASETAQV
ncbi:hypothetical protein VSA01S_24900 [Vibrio sagamiensis NBRC 104589]|uniref:Tryptophanase n=1 Tax=Vibrio sagamiensis NBRC 104589 TaxID=1219064 RepID=A0A511QGF2_9VIBR|nr:hypothetical protein VSA01S_24900 [Vibrio sagamiensis NBRC 104589]